MGSPNNLKAFDFTGKYTMPFPPPSISQADSSIGSLTISHEGANYHQRCSSESFLIEEQPSWLDDLLNDTEPNFQRGHHRRSASDSYAYFGEAAETFTLEDESTYVYPLSARLQNLMHFKDVDDPIFSETNADSLVKKNYPESEEVVSSLVVEHSRDETSSQNLEDSADKCSGSQIKPSGSKTDSKRSKQQNAHRSRVRKLQYIAHLERTVQILKVEGSEVGAELEFIKQQNIILSMENRALRQRLDSISQEHIIKQWEQGMLEREIGRLQNLYHIKNQQQMQNQHQQRLYNKNRRNKSKDFDHRLNAAPLKNKDITSNEGTSVDAYFRI